MNHPSVVPSVPQFWGFSTGIEIRTASSRGEGKVGDNEGVLTMIGHLSVPRFAKDKLGRRRVVAKTLKHSRM